MIASFMMAGLAVWGAAGELVLSARQMSVGPHAIGHGGRYTVAAALPLVEGLLADEIRSLAMESVAGRNGLIQPVEKPTVRIDHETFSEDRYSIDGSQISRMIKQELMASRVLAGRGHYWGQAAFPDPDNAPPEPTDRSSPLLTEDAYDQLVAFEASLRLGDHVLPVHVQRLEPNLIRDSGKALLAASNWLIKPGAPREFQPALQEAQIGDPGVKALSERDFWSLPTETTRRMLSFDFWRESIGLPHSVGAYETFIMSGANNHKLLGAKVYEVTWEGTSIGFIIQALYSSHKEIEYPFSRDIYDALRFTIARFDRQGHRMAEGTSHSSLWTSSEPDSPVKTVWENLHKL